MLGCASCLAQCQQRRAVRLEALGRRLPSVKGAFNLKYLKGWLGLRLAAA